MQQNDEDAFRAAMADVAPLTVPQRQMSPTGVVQTPGLARRRAQAVAQTVKDNALSGDVEMRYGPHDIISFQREGIQHGVFRKLKQGAYPLDARLDLHTLTVEQARMAIAGFVRDCLEHDVRSALVIHGKNLRSGEPARLKNFVARWLIELEAVQAYHSAQPQHGGAGAVYVLLRKSERSKLENALRFRNSSG